MAKTRFTIDARAVLALGRENVKDHVTAVLELVKNSYDADATAVDIDIQTKTTSPHIRIADDGHGMSLADVQALWLRIGYSGKRKQPISKKHRRRTGEKGVGRLSADRLGSTLELRSRAVNGPPAAITIDWAQFDVPERELAQIVVEVADKPVQPAAPRSRPDANTGTEIIIANLRNTWTPADIRSLYQELALFAPPASAPTDFEIHLNNDVDPSVNGRLEPVAHNVPELRVNLTLTLGEKIPASGKREPAQVSYFVYVRTKTGDERLHSSNTLPWPQFISGESPQDGNLLGPARADLSFFRRKPQAIGERKLNLVEISDYLDRFGGIRIYRDAVRVRPYGTPGEDTSDWLGLGARKVSNPAGRSRKSFRVSPNQVIGAIHISRDDNPLLADSTSREGLVSNDAFRQLRDLVLGGIRLLESSAHAIDPPESPKEPTGSPRALSAELSTANRVLRDVRRRLETGRPAEVKSVLAQLPALQQTLAKSQAQAEEFANQTAVLRGLATVGIASAVFGHETQTSLDQAQNATSLGVRLLSKASPDIARVRSELESAIQHLDRVTAWGEFALVRVRREKRQKRRGDVHPVVLGILKAFEPLFKANGVVADTHKVKPVTANFYTIDVEAMLVNLVTNAYTACMTSKRARRIRIELQTAREGGRNGFRLNVGDSGPGVAKHLHERIWEPLFTTVPAKVEARRFGGTGLGLSIVQSIVDDYDGKREVRKDPDLHGAQFSIWLPSE